MTLILKKNGEPFHLVDFRFSKAHFRSFYYLEPCCVQCSVGLSVELSPLAGVGQLTICRGLQAGAVCSWGSRLHAGGLWLLGQVVWDLECLSTYSHQNTFSLCTVFLRASHQTKPPSSSTCLVHVHLLVFHLPTSVLLRPFINVNYGHWGGFHS